MERLDKHFKAITRAAFARHGFAHAEILNQWPAIAGDKLARCASPLKVRWPRQQPGSQKTGGTLVIRVEPAMALDLHYEAPRLIERVNCYFGYAAIAAIRIVQGRVATGGRQPSRAPGSPPEPSHRRDRLSGITDGPLEEALSRLGSRIARQGDTPRRG